MKKYKKTYVVITIILLFSLLIYFTFFSSLQTIFSSKTTSTGFTQYTAPVKDDRGVIDNRFTSSPIVIIPFQDIIYRFETSTSKSPNGDRCFQVINVYRNDISIDVLNLDSNNLIFTTPYYYNYNGKTTAEDTKQKISFHFDSGRFNYGQCYFAQNSYTLNFADNSIQMDFPDSTIKNINSDINLSINIINNFKKPVKATLILKTKYYGINGIIEKEYQVQKDIPKEGTNIEILIPKQYIEQKIEFIPSLNVIYSIEGIVGADTGSLTGLKSDFIIPIMGDKIIYNVEEKEIIQEQVESTSSDTSNVVSIPIFEQANVKNNIVTTQNIVISILLIFALVILIYYFNRKSKKKRK